MNNIGIIMFNTASMSDKIKKSNLVNIINLHITIGGEEFTSNSLEELEKKVSEKKEIPKTSQPTTGEIINKYEKTLKKYDDVIVLSPDKHLSGTHQNVILAKSMLKEKQENIHIIELKSFAIIEGLACEKAIDFIEAGKDIEFIKKELSEIADKLTTYIIPGSFDYLKMSGRVKISQAIVSKLLSLNIVIKHKDGEANLYKKGRGFKNILKQCDNDLLLQKDIKEIWLANIQTDKKELEQVENVLKKHGDTYKINYGSMVMAAHFGPKTIGYSVIKK